MRETGKVFSRNIIKTKFRDRNCGKYEAKLDTVVHIDYLESAALHFSGKKFLLVITVTHDFATRGAFRKIQYYFISAHTDVKQE